MRTSKMPEEAGIPSAGIASFLERLEREKYNLHSIQICRDGETVFSAAVAPFTIQSPHRLFSAAKAIISLPVLFAIQEGKMRFEDHVIDFFPEMIPAKRSENLCRMTVYDLMTMQTGMKSDPFVQLLQDESTDLVRCFFETPVEKRPGTGFRYNNSVPHVLYTLVERATKTDFETYLNSHVCEPLEAPITAQYSSSGIYNPLTTVMSNESLLHIGEFYTQFGSWKGHQLIDESLMRYATRYHVPTDPNQKCWKEESGYGMQVMRNSYGGFRLPGGFGQFAICLPDDHLTVSIMSADERIVCLLDAFREEIYSSIQVKPLPENWQGVKKLQEAVKNLTYAPEGKEGAAGRDFPLNRVFHFALNEHGLQSLSIRQQNNEVLLEASVNGALLQARCGMNGEWSLNQTHFFAQPDRSLQQAIYTADPEQCFLSGAWTDDNTFTFVQQCLGEMGHTVCRITYNQECVSVAWPKPVGMGRATLDGCTVLRSEKE